MNSTGPKSGPRPWPSRGGGMLWATGGGMLWAWARSQHPGPARWHGRGARRWYVGRQGPRESVIEGRASRRAWKWGGELAIGVA
jgi:hypothetical protein